MMYKNEEGDCQRYNQSPKRKTEISQDEEAGNTEEDVSNDAHEEYSQDYLPPKEWDGAFLQVAAKHRKV